MFVVRESPTPPAIVFKLTLRQHLEKVFPNQELVRWFDPLGVAVDDTRNVLRVSFPHAFFAHWFMVNIKQDFERQTSHLVEGMTIEYESGTPAQAVANAGGMSVAAFPARTPRKEIFTRPSPLISTRPTVPEPERSLPEIMLPEQFTFAAFLVNRKNDFPLAAARKSVSENSASAYSPFVIYGASGAGKSHLLGAMANAASAAGRPFFYGGIAFLERMIASPGRHAPVGEHMVFLDDAQRVAACTEMQDTLAALIDIFQATGRLLALTLDAHPASCARLRQKLRSRLTSGLVVEVKRPDLDIRRQYAQRENETHNLGLTKEQLLELAQRYQDIRAIDGALTRLSAYRTLLHRQGSEGQAPDVTSILERGSDHTLITPAGIIMTVARYFSLPPEDISGKNRDRKTALARHIAIMLCRELLGLSLVQTGRVFSGRDHSSVLYSIKKIKQLQASDKDMHNQVEELRKLCLTRH